MKKALANYWKVLVAILLIAAAALVVVKGYIPDKDEFEANESSLTSEIAMLQSQILLNDRYEDVQAALPSAIQAIEDSRQALYKRFPADLLEEDQIMYVLYLEQKFGTEINFSFGSVAPIASLSDSSTLGGVTLTVNYETTYQGFKDMIDYLATDSRITSIQYCTLTYDEASDKATGDLTLLCYTLSPGEDAYTTPEVPKPNTGKPSIFD